MPIQANQERKNRFQVLGVLPILQIAKKDSEGNSKADQGKIKQ